MLFTWEEGNTMMSNSQHHLTIKYFLQSLEAKESIIYSYRHGFSGFAAKLTEAQAKRIAELPDGRCESGERFDPAKACNRKLIGAKYFMKGSEAFHGGKFDHKIEFKSPRDRSGHGTHTASTAGGSFSPNVSYHGLAYGTVRGGAPKARIAMYKVCYNGGGCHNANVIMAIDQAIHDGVDILSMSFGAEPPLSPDVDFTVASLSAVTHGITVVSSAGNKRSLPQTVVNISPWMLTVAASSIDRSLPTLITLGKNRTFIVRSRTWLKTLSLTRITKHI
ncbi:hypothetical protein R3W88_009274 [Solanum pinnatisectum]|uniref:Uncharacterized protein n=1 Tax=Solanum pinnatisectum TaxID=50273 RepID=A0AAV9MAV9_9SOLN|nr:hypothetical protein R3W88_009274 [Solanum pinnatisectum]